jgi:hypothetical protein
MAKKKKSGTAKKGKKSGTAKKGKKSSTAKKGKKSSPPKKTKKPSVPKKPKKKENGNGPYTPNICSDFTGDNGHQVAFQGIPPGGCTLGQDGANNVFPFSPNNTGNNGLKYITLYPGDITTIAVPALNQGYPYVVSCCPPAQGVHTVTVP